MRSSDWSPDLCSSDLYDASRPQAWYAIESMIFASALALSTVTGQVEIPPERRALITNWLVKIAKGHFNKPASNPSCRSEERRVGKKWVDTCRYRRLQHH